MASGGRTASRSRCSRSAATPARRSGPLLAAFIVVPRGQSSVAWFSAAALVGIVVLLPGQPLVQPRTAQPPATAASASGARHAVLSRKRVLGAIAILLVLMFSKYFYMASLSSLLHLLPDRQVRRCRCRARRSTCSLFLVASAAGTCSAARSATASAASR